MKRALVVIGIAGLASCASQQKTTTAQTAPAGLEQGAVVQPSSLSPEQIRLVQRSLIDRGFAVDLTGTFDEPTQSALTDFQRARGLPATAKLNTPTIEALGIDPRDVMPVAGQSASGAQGSGTAPATDGGASPGTDANGWTQPESEDGTSAPGH